MSRRCGTCRRELRTPDIPDGAGWVLRTLLEGAARICLWCHDVNLLAGGFEPMGLEERWDDTDLIAMRRQADERMNERRLDQWQRRSAKRAAREPAQKRIEAAA